MPNQWGLKEDEEMALTLPEQSPIRRGLNTLFGAVKNGELLYSVSPDLSSDQRHFVAGRMALLTELEAFLEQIYEGPSSGGLDDSEE